MGHSTLTRCLSPDFLTPKHPILGFLNLANWSTSWMLPMVEPHLGQLLPWFYPLRRGCVYTLPISPLCTIPCSPHSRQGPPQQPRLG